MQMSWAQLKKCRSQNILMYSEHLQCILGNDRVYTHNKFHCTMGCRMSFQYVLIMLTNGQAGRLFYVL